MIAVFVWSPGYAQQGNTPLTDTNTSVCSPEEAQKRAQYQCTQLHKENGVCKCTYQGSVYDLENAETAEMLSLVLRFIYVLMWPLMTIAWYAMDNKLVYGELFHMDIALWQFWNLIKNFANYFIAFYFVWSILKIVRSGWELSSVIPSLLKKTIIAAVGIQVSRWIIGMLLDLSTILTYGVWAIPLTVLKDDKALDIPILSTHTSYSLSDISSSQSNLPDTLIYYSYGTENYIQCSFTKQTIASDGAKNTIWTFVPPQTTDGIIGRNEYFSGKVAEIVLGFNTARAQINNGNPAETLTPDLFKKEYCVDNGKLLKYDPGIDLNIPEKYKIVYDAWTKHLIDDIQPQCQSKGIKCNTLSNLIDTGKGMTGPLYTLYSSILNFGNLAISTDNKTVYSLTLEFIIKSIFSILLVLPMLFICVMLVARALLMRIIIAFSPFLMIFYAFSKDNVVGSYIDKKTSDRFSEGVFSGALSLIFMPVIAVMSLSLGLVFMQVTTSMMHSQPKDFLDGLGIKKEWQGCHTMPGIFTICGSQNPTGDDGFSIFTNNFNRFIINLLAVGIIWFIMMTILKSVGIFSKFIENTTNLAQNLLKSAPIIPLPSGATSIAGLNQGLNKVHDHVNDKISDYNLQQWEEVMKKLWLNKSWNTQNKNSSSSTDRWTDTQQTLDAMPSITTKNITSWSPADKLTKNTAKDYQQTENMQQALTTMGNDIWSVLQQIDGTKEWSKTIQNIATWYEKMTNTSLAREENGLVSHKTLTQWLTSSEFRTQMANSLYRRGISKSKIDAMMDTFGDVQDSKGQNTSFKQNFWSTKAQELNEKYQKHNVKKTDPSLAPIITHDRWSHKYLYETWATSQDVVITNTKFNGDNLESINNIYHFTKTDTIGQLNAQSRISISHKHDLQSLSELVYDIQSISNITDADFDSNGILSLFQDQSIKKIIDSLTKKSTTIQVKDRTYTVSYDATGKATIA